MDTELAGVSTRAGVSPSPAPLVRFFDPPLTAGLWNVYERATHSYACTRAFIEYFVESAGAVLALVSDESTTAFLYRVRPGGRAAVLGRYWAAAPRSLGAFARAVFDRHPEVGAIETNLVDALTEADAVGLPVLAVGEATEMRIALPPAADEPDDRSRKTRGHTQYHERRLTREHPAAQLVTREREQIPRSWIGDIVRLNHERMASKNTVSVYGERYEEGIFRVARSHGCVTVLLDGSRVCAGTIDIVCGTDAYAWVIGHDSAYQKYSPGRLCQVAAIRHYVEAGVRTLHLLQGESRHKRDLGGTRAPLAAYVILRSWARLTPGDLSRLCRKHLLRRARRLIERADAVTMSVLDGRTPLSSLARSIARRWRAGAR